MYLEIAQFVSLWLGFSSIIAAAWTLKHYWPRAHAFLRNPTTLDFTGWLVLGVCFGFAGSVLDSSYWQAAWSSAFLNHFTRAWLFDHGVMANILFRNIALLLAAYCHYRAYLIAFPDRSGREANRFIAICLGAGLALTLGLVALK